jgi:hypothetical protein
MDIREIPGLSVFPEMGNLVILPVPPVPPLHENTVVQACPTRRP